VLLPSLACSKPTVNPQEDLSFAFLWSKRLVDPLHGSGCSINTSTIPLCFSIFKFQNVTLADFMFCVLLFSSYQKHRSSSLMALASLTQAQWHRLQYFLSGPIKTGNQMRHGLLASPFFSLSKPQRFGASFGIYLF
jgi:hypothetical protein